MWSNDEKSILKALALQVRLMSLNQVARGWFANDTGAATSALNRLCRVGLVDLVILEAHPLIDLPRALLVWEVGSPSPDDAHWETIAARSQSRWRLPHTPIQAYRASKRACRAFGAFVNALHARHSEATHDVHLSEVFIGYRTQHPRDADHWFGEGAFPKLGFEIRGMKDPDAFLVRPDGVAYRVIEFAGSYEIDHLRAIHAHCAGGAVQRLNHDRGIGGAAAFHRLYPAEGINYELW